MLSMADPEGYSWGQIVGQIYETFSFDPVLEGC